MAARKVIHLGPCPASMDGNNACTCGVDAAGLDLTPDEHMAAVELKQAGLQLETTFRAYAAAKERHQAALGRFHRATGATSQEPTP